MELSIFLPHKKVAKNAIKLYILDIRIKCRILSKFMLKMQSFAKRIRVYQIYKVLSVGG